MQEKQSYFKAVSSHSLLWFGAAVSVAEIYTGTLLAPLGFKKAALAIVLGHLIGFLLLYATGRIGGRTGESAMGSTASAFGKYGAKCFALLNVTQLVGWTAVMIIGAAKSLAGLGILSQSIPLWSIVTGLLVLAWIILGLEKLSLLNNISVIALLGLTILMSFVVFKGTLPTQVEGTLSLGLGVELSIAMPLSWLPLISDYTKHGGNRRSFSFASALAYTLGSAWMYLIGLGAALYAGSSDLAVVLSTAGLGAAALIVVLLSTVTTTFLDAYSAGESSHVLFSGVSTKQAAIFVTLLGTGLAVVTPIENYQNFLYFIGSVFAPMIAIQLVTHYTNTPSNLRTSIVNMLLWGLGFMLYRQFLSLETVLGATVPVMISIGGITLLVHQLIRKLIPNKEVNHVSTSIGEHQN